MGKQHSSRPAQSGWPYRQPVRFSRVTIEKRLGYYLAEGYIEDNPIPHSGAKGNTAKEAYQKLFASARYWNWIAAQR